MVLIEAAERTPFIRAALIRALILGALLGAVCAFIAVKWSPRLGIIACCCSVLSLGMFVGAFWIDHQIPPSGPSKRIGLAAGLATVAVFLLGTAGSPATQSFVHSLFSGGNGSYNAVFFVVATLAVASLGLCGVTIRLYDVTFCQVCSSWSRCNWARSHFDGSKEELKARLLARNIDCLLTDHDTGRGSYQFKFTSCRCDGVQILDVGYDDDAGTETPTRTVVRRLKLTRAETETIGTQLPQLLRRERNGPGAMVVLGTTLTFVIYAFVRLAGF